MMQMQGLSSGNVTADRRYDYAQALMKEADYAAAVELFEQTLELVPDWAACWFALGEAFEKSNEFPRSIAAFEKCIQLFPDEPFGARMHLQRLGQRVNSTSQAYIAALFDQYAPRFDAHLTQALHYRGPQILAQCLDKLAPQQKTFNHFIDLGCGTGLMARALEGRYQTASGVDLSAQMIRIAEKTGLYTRLHVGEMSDFVGTVAPKSGHLVLAADVFVYIGALDDIFKAVRRVLAEGGLFGFSVQAAEGDDFAVGEDLRFAHSERYLRKLAAQYGFTIQLCEAHSTRQDQGRDVPGLIMFLS